MATNNSPFSSLARAWLMARGWGYSEDHAKLAVRLEECCGEFVEELEEEYERLQDLRQ